MSKVKGQRLIVGEWPRAILHIDGDAFFASCEVALNPALKGKPVIVGQEKGIATAFSYEAKARGVKRGMLVSEIKKICPDAIVLPGDYHTYGIFSERMFAIVRRYTPRVEEYSIDECFADLSFLLKQGGMENVRRVVRKIKTDLESELNMTFSLGIAPTKVLAKVASKWKKPAGLTFVPLSEKEKFLKDIPISKIWGIGPSTSVALEKKGIKTAFDFIMCKENWVRENLARPYLEIWAELNGISVFGINEYGHDAQKSIRKTETFRPATNNKAYVFAELSKNVERACVRARRVGLVPCVVSFYLKTQDFRYFAREFKLSYPHTLSHEIIKMVQPLFEEIFSTQNRYRATGVIFSKLQNGECVQDDFFGTSRKNKENEGVYKVIDSINARFGSYSLCLASSLKSIEKEGVPSFRKRFTLPFMGEVA